MYIKHKALFALIIVAVGIISFVAQVDYAEIASEGITIVSIILAIYMTSFSSLVSSDLAREMQKKEDKNLKGKSQLGVLRGYLNVAVIIGIINLIISCVILIFQKKYQEEIIKVCTGITLKKIVYFFVSSCGIATLSGSLFLMLLLYKFMVNRQLWSK